MFQPLQVLQYLDSVYFQAIKYKPLMLQALQCPKPLVQVDFRPMNPKHRATSEDSRISHIFLYFQYVSTRLAHLKCMPDQGR
jgi:hypothetical protein